MTKLVLIRSDALVPVGPEVPDDILERSIGQGSYWEMWVGKKTRDTLGSFDQSNSLILLPVSLQVSWQESFL